MFLDHFVTKWIENNRLKVHPQRCIRTRNRFSKCQKCEEICPVSAITVQGGLSVLEEVCTECMRCTVTCPTEALYDERYSEFFNEMYNREVISFSCENDTREHPYIRLGCFFQLDKTLLLFAYQNSTKVIVQFNEERCMKCKKYDGELVSSLERVITEFNSMLKEPIKIHFNESESSIIEPYYTRRQLFTFFSKKITRNLVNPLIKDEDEVKNLRESITSGLIRDKTIHLLRKNQELLNEMQETQCLNTIQLIFNEQCDGCGICGKVCPTGALSFNEDESNLAVNFNVQICNGCKSCIDICRKDALIVNDKSLIALSSFLKGEKQDMLLNSMN